MIPKHSDKFLVWNPDAEFPTISHPNYDAAVKESERLAAINPGHIFHVMAPVGYSFVEKPAVFCANRDYLFTPF